jgi:transposase-like protein
MMTEATKTNYTPEQTLELVNLYKAGETVEALATHLGKSTRSIVAKLSREGVYQAKTKATKPRVRKADLVDKLAAICGVAPEIFESLEKANQDVLEVLVETLTRQA